MAGPKQEEWQEDNRDIFDKALDAGKWGAGMGAALYLGAKGGGKAAKNLAKVVAKPKLTRAELAETDAFINKFSRRAGYFGSAAGAGIGGSAVGAQRPKKPRK